ncbi:hypothetical protein BDW69DRAFT_191026 [Aspergillus filifer]
MKVRAHARDTYTVPGQQSRIDQDLAGIIGAGFAGLRCAEVLINCGAQVTIFEARNRIGGRNMVDIGPNWIHGTSTNPILRLANRTGTVLCRIVESPCIFKTDSQLMSKTKATELLDILWDIISKAFKYSNEHCVSISPTRSLQDFVIEKACHLGLSVEDQALILQIAEILKHFWLEECFRQRILHALAESALEHAEIITEARIVLIQNTGVDDDPHVLIKIEDSRTFKFNSIVITVPLGLLKRQSPTFPPPLPPQISRAIDGASYSSLEKVLIEFPSALVREASCSYIPEFWPTHLVTIYGPCAEYVTSQTATLHPASQGYFEFLDNFFRSYYSLLPNYNPDNSCCQPNAGRAVSLEDDLRALRHDMPEHNIWIAGEHAATFVALGTLTRAYWSGESVAIRMLRGEDLKR